MNIFMISLLIYTLYTSYKREKAEVVTDIENLTLLLERSISSDSKEIDVSLQNIQADLEKELRKEKQLNYKEIENLIQKQQNEINHIAKIQMTDASGQVKLSTTGGTALNYAHYAFFKNIQQQTHDQLVVTKLIRNPEGQGWVNLFVRPYHYADGTFAGVVIATMPSRYFNDLITHLNLDSKGVAIIQDLDMRVIARNPMLKTPNGQVGFIGAAPELTRLVHSNLQFGIVYTRQTTDKVQRLGGFRKLSNMPIFVAVAFAQQDYLDQWYNDLFKAMLSEFLFLLVTTVSGWVLWHQIQANILANRRSQILLQNAHDGIHVLDIQGQLLEGSESFFRMIGRTPEEALGKMPAYWDPQCNNTKFYSLIQNESLATKGLCFETSYQNAQGESYPVEVSVILIQIENSKLFFCSARDITERKKAEEDQRIAATAFDSQVGMLITDTNLNILRSNQAFTQITGYSVQELIGQTPRILQSGLNDKNFYVAMWDQIRTTGSWQGEIWNKRKNGEIYPQSLLIASVRDDQGRPTHYVASITDLSDYKASEEKVRLLAFYDPLTKLPNRRLFLEQLEQSLHDAKMKKRVGILLYVNLDNFKALNDTAGHETGDCLLQQVAARLLECVGAGQMVARLGSDEFIILLEQPNDCEKEAIQHAESIAKRILRALAQPYFFNKLEYRSTASIGISLFGLQEYENIQDPVKHADLAMTEAKNYGRNTYRFFDPLIQSQVQERANIDAGLRQALEQNQFILYYQPQVNGAKQITGVEALIRWKHPIQGMISPAYFIPVAEENGFIITLGQWVLETACQQLNEWSKHPDTAQLSIAVNVSASQFARDEFVQDVLDTLQRTQAPAYLLKLELTESALAMRLEAMIEKMKILKAHGVMLSLDDFGTGYSSLSYLKQIPIDQLKIDQSFVRDIVSNANDAAIAKMIIVLAKTFGISVLAEGVETEAQRDLLEQYGCCDYQGYLFAKPMPIDELEFFISTTNSP